MCGQRKTLGRILPRLARGAALSEFIVVLPALLLLGLGTLQTALIYHAKTTLNYATFEAARKGAVNHAQRAPMREELGLRLGPVFGGDGSVEKALGAITQASLDVRAGLGSGLSLSHHPFTGARGAREPGPAGAIGQARGSRDVRSAQNTR